MFFLLPLVAAASEPLPPVPSVGQPDLRSIEHVQVRTNESGEVIGCAFLNEAGDPDMERQCPSPYRELILEPLTDKTGEPRAGLRIIGRRVAVSPAAQQRSSSDGDFGSMTVNFDRRADGEIVKCVMAGTRSFNSSTKSCQQFVVSLDAGNPLPALIKAYRPGTAARFRLQFAIEPWSEPSNLSIDSSAEAALTMAVKMEAGYQCVYRAKGQAGPLIEGYQGMLDDCRMVEGTDLPIDVGFQPDGRVALSFYAEPLGL